MNESEIRYKQTLRIIEMQQEEIKKLRTAVMAMRDAAKAEGIWGCFLPCEYSEDVDKALGLEE